MRSAFVLALLVVAVASAVGCTEPASNAISNEDLARWRASGPRSYPADVAARLVDQSLLESKPRSEVVELLGDAPIAAGYIVIGEPGDASVVYPLAGGGGLEVVYDDHKVREVRIERSDAGE